MNIISKFTTMVTFTAMITVKSYAQFPAQDKWYQNPLGFQPLNLHTNMGFLIPAAIAGTALLLTKKDSTLHNRLSLYSEMGLTFGYKYPFTTVVQNNTGVNLMMRRWFSIGAEFSTTAPFDEYNSTVGFAIRPFARFYAINGSAWKLWFESGGGMIYLLDNFPKPTTQDSRLGTFWNGTTKYGLGTSLRLKNNMDLMFGARHLHISNGNTKGVERNPSHDSNGLFAGFSWTIK